LGELEKAHMEKQVAEGWFLGRYSNQNQVELIAEIQGLSMDMVKYWYGKCYHEQERSSCE